MHWAVRFADALEINGVPREAVLELAGANQHPTVEGLDARIANLPADRQLKVLQYLADQEALHAQDKQPQDGGNEAGAS